MQDEVSDQVASQVETRAGRRRPCQVESLLC